MAAKMTVYHIKYKKIFSETDKVIAAIESNILTITHANYVILKQQTCMPNTETQDL